MKLRYTGTAPTTFVALGLEVQPDEVFEVPEDLSPGLLARADIEEVRVRAVKKAAPAKAPAKEIADAAPDDH